METPQPTGLGLNGDQLFWIVLAALGGLTIVFGVLGEYLTARTKISAKTRQLESREETKREIAAYVAEGSLSPDDAERILVADASTWEKILKGRKGKGDGGDRAQA